jgi:dihydrodipicolinate reductase
MPSGGDWALQRSGAVFMQGTELCTVAHFAFQEGRNSFSDGAIAIARWVAF